MSKRKIVRKSRRLSHTKTNTLFLFIFLLVILISGLFFYRTIPDAKPRTLVYLTIPKVSRVYSPAPLEITPLNTNVLGAEVFDPTDLVKFVNIERAKTGSPALRLNYTLMKAAQMRADVILKHQNFSHQDPYENIELVTILAKLGFNYVYASENIGMGGTSGENFVEGFMHSNSHKQNLLNPRLSETGVGLATGPYKQYYVNIVSQFFAIPGGKDEYLGYSKEDKKKYKKLMSESEFTLNPIIWNVYKLLGKKDFTQDRYKKLKKQKEILAEIYKKMEKDNPLDDKDVTLIIKYNEQNT